jgi:hypothetical protein
MSNTSAAEAFAPDGARTGRSAVRSGFYKLRALLAALVRVTTAELLARIV